MNVRIDVRSSLGPAMRRITDAREGPARTELHRAMGTEVQQLTTEHLRTLANTRHTTAERLGATPSNHLAQAAEKVAAPAALNADGTAAVLTINHVGMVRALRDVTIRPREAKSLAIPIHAIAYNRRPKQLTLEGHELFVLGGKGQDTGRNILATRRADGSVLPLYVLVRSVTQKQDRSLLPSDAEWTAAAAKGATGYIKMQLSAGENL